MGKPFNCPTGQAMTNFIMDPTENFIHAGHSVYCTKACAQQDLVKVLSVVGLCFLGRSFNCFGGKSSAFRKDLLSLIIDGRLNRTSALRSPDSRHQDRPRTARRQRHGERSNPLRKEVNGGHGESFKCSIELATKTLVLGLIHDTAHLIRVLAGLS